MLSEAAALLLRQKLAELEAENKILRARNIELEARVAGKEDVKEDADRDPSAEKEVQDADLDPTDEERRVLLDHLRDSTYVLLKASALAGVGVFALKDIPAGVDPFRCVNERFQMKERFCIFTPSMLRDANVPEPVMEQVKSMFAPLTTEDDYTADRDRNGEVKYGVLASGLHSLNLSWYLNHSETPNVGFEDAATDGTFNSFVTKRRIAADEELLVNYKELGEEYLNLVHEHEGDLQSRGRPEENDEHDHQVQVACGVAPTQSGRLLHSPMAGTPDSVKRPAAKARLHRL